MAWRCCSTLCQRRLLIITTPSLFSTEEIQRHVLPFHHIIQVANKYIHPQVICISSGRLFLNLFASFKHGTNPLQLFPTYRTKSSPALTPVPANFFAFRSTGNFNPKYVNFPRIRHFPFPLHSRVTRSTMFNDTSSPTVSSSFLWRRPPFGPRQPQG